MNILVTYPWLDLGGAPNTAITLAKGLKERGHKVWFLTREGGMYERRLREAGLTLVAAPYHRTLPHLYHLNRRAHRIMCRTIDDCRIDIVHAFHPHSWLLALFSAPPRGVPVFLTAVWFVGKSTFPDYPGWLLFVAREFMDQGLPLFGGRMRHAEVMPNRIDLEMFHPRVETSDFAREHRLAPGGCRIVFMSRIDHTKIRSLRSAVEAVRILGAGGGEVSLAIAGDGERAGELAALAREVNADLGREAVVVLGPVARTPELLCSADIVFGIGRCAWEGMACGKPTVVVGENGFAGIAEPGTVDELAYCNFAGRNRREPASPAELAAAVQGLIDSPGRRAELGAFARRYVLENYDYRAGARRLEELYTEALGATPLSGAELRRLRRTLWTRGYARRLWVALKLKRRRTPVMGVAPGA